MAELCKDDAVRSHTADDNLLARPNIRSIESFYRTGNRFGHTCFIKGEGVRQLDNIILTDNQILGKTAIDVMSEGAKVFTEQRLPVFAVPALAAWNRCV